MDLELELEKINKYTEFGDKLIDLTDMFKRDAIEKIRKEQIRSG